MLKLKAWHPYTLPNGPSPLLVAKVQSAQAVVGMQQRQISDGVPTTCR